MRIIVSGGGTAGHISPVLATLEELEKLDKKLVTLFIGSGKDIEKKILKSVKLNYTSVPVGKFRRYNRGLLKASLDLKTNWQNLADFFKVNAGVIKARKVIKDFKPDIIFIKGGYVGLPVGIAARSLKVPFINHESDIVPGITNRYLSRWSEKTAVGFPAKYYQKMDKNKLVFVGNPLRKSTLNASKKQANEFFSLDETKPVLLVIGGSQGAQSINDLVFDELDQILKKYQLIHLTGEKGRGESLVKRRSLKKDLKNNYHPFSFLVGKMGLAYAACDLVITRAGANTIAEIACWAKPSIVIPMSKSANNHQKINGEVLKNAGAAVVLNQDNLTSENLISEIDNLWNSKDKRSNLSKNIKNLEKRDAAHNLAKLIYESGYR